MFKAIFYGRHYYIWVCGDFAPLDCIGSSLFTTLITQIVVSQRRGMWMESGACTCLVAYIVAIQKQLSNSLVLD